MKRVAVLHPVLFALFFVVALYSANAAEVSPQQVVLPALVAIAGATLLMGAGWLIYRDVTKAAVVASILVVLCFSYGHVVNLVARNPDYGFMAQANTPLAYVVFLAWMVLGAVGIYMVWRTRRDLRNAAKVLGVIGTFLVMVSTVTVAVREIGGSGRGPVTVDATTVELEAPVRPRDIFYIILDRYASGSTLGDIYGFDNSEFLSYLTEKGFYVASESCANYFRTEHSLASSLNMDYLGGLADQGVTSTDEAPIYDMLKDYHVLRSLSTAGYRSVHLGSWWEPTRENEYADVNITYRGQLPEFSMLLLRTTALDPIGEASGLWGEPRKTQWERVKYKFERLGEMSSTEGPKFVFAHFLVPHPDYVFERDGSFREPITYEEAAAGGMKTRYIDQVVATNNMVISLVDKLLDGSEPAPVIIIQSDEGPVPGAWPDWSVWKWNDTPDSELQEKIRILNAYYLPGDDACPLYASISPVNTFRVILNMYFNTDLEILPDRSYVHERGRPYDFRDVTEIVKY